MLVRYGQFETGSGEVLIGRILGYIMDADSNIICILQDEIGWAYQVLSHRVRRANDEYLNPYPQEFDIPLSYIYLKRAEGRHEECESVLVSYSFEQADGFLRAMALSCRKGGGIDKVDFEVHFADGFVYGGTYYLDYIGRHDASLVHHIVRHLTSQAPNLLKTYHIGDVE